MQEQVGKTNGFSKNSPEAQGPDPDHRHKNGNPDPVVNETLFEQGHFTSQSTIVGG